jgi:hypothetical protein
MEAHRVSQCRQSGQHDVLGFAGSRQPGTVQIGVWIRRGSFLSPRHVYPCAHLPLEACRNTRHAYRDRGGQRRCEGANVSLLGSGMQDVVVNSDGRFRFDNVAVGNYTVSAGLNINGYFNTAEVTVQINAGTTTNVAVPLQPPPEIYRLITIWVENRLTGVRRLRTARAILPRPRRSKCSHSTHAHTSTSMVHPTSRRGPTLVST